jgi:hypothetical protein
LAAPSSEGFRGVCIRYFTPAPGILTSIENEELLTPSPIVYDAAIYCKKGDKIPEVRSSLDRSGHVIVTAPTAQEAIAQADELVSRVRLITQSPSKSAK